MIIIEPELARPPPVPDDPWLAASAGAIRRLRQALRVTQAELARLVGVNQKTVERWENGHWRYLPCAAARRALGRLAADRGIRLFGPES